MIYSRPFVTSEFTAYEGDSRSRAVSLAVRLTDEFTLRSPDVKLRLTLRPLLPGKPNPRSVRGAGGAYCFEDAPNGNYTLTIETEGTTPPLYLLSPMLVTVPLLVPDPTIPLLDITLSPSSAYPFPPGATLARGVVQSIVTGNVPGAIVSTTYDQVDPADEFLTVPVNVETRTDRDGQFALFFRRLPGNTQDVVITAAQGGNQVQAPVTITEGTTQMVNMPALP